MEKQKCLLESLGSCAGCSIREIVLYKRKSIPRDQEKSVIAKVSRDLCPEGTVIQVPERREPSIW